MNKIYKYKPGDKVIILIGIFGYKSNDIGKIIKCDADGYIIDVPNKIPHVWFRPNSIKYYYEKPLQNLFIQINVADHLSNNESDYDIIRSFINSDKTLTNEELIICQRLWEKYNKRNNK